ncbi:MAG: GtrA family protein [Lachnospiraceae bacterium]|nr:GtrA family protein [Lachnospiraceae bacterium]MBQ3973486.1 GtrA family protein [Lachnospiraceae bacterium]MBQ4303793.1 GtrA family protein [Lachnospiraceae bacterium]MBQ5361489.1 GtrA family protein [Lachnospiraceae bacterium]
MIRKLFDITFWKFILVGIVNTLVGTAVMFGCYNLLHFSYWVSSAANYVVGSVVSYFLNKNFTFRNKSKDPMVLVRFVVNITVCYLLAYGIAKPLVRRILSGSSVRIQENGAMLVGMCLFVGLNYLGQRFFAFREKED